METLRETTTRLRRSFQYPADEDVSGAGESEPEAMDEQEQEALITRLATLNSTRDARFRLYLLCLTGAASLPYFVTLLVPGGSSSRSSSMLLPLLALTSLAATAWTLRALPPTVTGIRRLDALGSSPGIRAAAKGKGRATGGSGGWGLPVPLSRGGGSGRRNLNAGARGRAAAEMVGAAVRQYRTPLETHLPYLNVGLCGVLALLGFVGAGSRQGGGGGEQQQGLLGSLGLGCLPAVVYGVVLGAKMVMAGVDPEEELAGLRYGYKGA